MRRMLLVACLALSFAQPARAEDSWFARSWQHAKACAADGAECVQSFAAHQGKKISEASGRALKWVQQSARECTPAESKRRYGLTTPASLDDKRPLVVLIHGLDSEQQYFCDLSALLEEQGFQVARFDYPNDQAIAESGKLLTREVAELRAARQGIRLDFVTHSMGALVARSFVEGPAYDGGVERMILLAPPNHGSSYGRWSCGSEIVEHFLLWRNDARWHWSWPFLDGVGEAGDDLQPSSDFLATLNAQPRRDGVRYTIVAGNRSCGWRYAATGVRFVSCCIPDFNTAADDALRDRFVLWAGALGETACNHDGLVALDSARLEGVDDFVVVPGDHTTIACSRDGRPPAAWDVIKDRLARQP